MAQRPLQELDRDPVWMPVFRALARGVDPVMVVDAAGRIQKLSKPVGAIRPSDLAAGPVWASSVTCGRLLEAAVQHTFDPGLSQSAEIDVDGAGSKRWYRVMAFPYGDQDHRVCFLQWHDLDEQHREMDRLRHSEHMMQDAEGMAHLGTWYWDITEPHARWSPELFEIYGLDPKTHVPTYEDYLQRVHPDDRQRVKEATEGVFNDHITYSHDERIRHSSGVWRHLHTWARPVLDDDGNLKALQGVCIDVTQRKEAELALAEAEARQRLILDSAGFGIASLDLEGRIEQANARFDELTGKGQQLGARLHEDLSDALAGVVEGGPQRIAAEVGDRQVEVLLTLADADEGPFVVAVARDVTVERLVREADAQIQQLEARRESQARIVGVAGHELKNPLTPILIELAMLQRGHLGDLSERQTKAVTKIHRQVERMRSLLQDLLDASKAEVGHLQLSLQDVDVSAIVMEAARAHHATAEEFGVKLHIDAPTQCLARVDVGRLVQVIDNLVVNALRFTPKGKRVDVRVECGDRWRLTVRDEGIGIPEDQQKDIFEAYVTGDHEAPHPMASNGLGLFVVRAIVESHGGRIHLESEPGHGTVVTAEIPARPPISDDE